MTNRWRNGKVYGAVAGILMGAFVLNMPDAVLSWRLPSYTWDRVDCNEGSAQRVAIESLMAVRDDTSQETWCRDLAWDEEACEEDFDVWYDEVVRPVALRGARCLLDGDSASFEGGGSTPHEVANAHGGRSVIICEGLDERLEIITAATSDRIGEENHKLVSMSWVAPDPS